MQFSAMWKTLYQSVPGTSHQRVDEPCQDSCAVREIEIGGDRVLVLCCSDGAGSAEFSQVGSRLACDTLVDAVARELTTTASLGTFEANRGLEYLHQVHAALAQEAATRAIEMRQLACTLLFAVLGKAGAAFGQVGDGAIVVWQDGAYQNIFWPQSGEYVNTTNFITDPRYPALFEFAWRAGPIDEVALFTDGLQMLGLDYQKRQAHGPFFEPMFQALRAKDSAAELMEPLRAFLDSPDLCARTDDDKTLILATRVAP